MPRAKSATVYLLQALIPYSKANMKLAFKPSLFFTEFAKFNNITTNTGRNAFHRAIKQRLIEIDSNNVPRLTDKGRRHIAPFTAKRLRGAKLMVIFDIPEKDAWKRRQFRMLLKELDFQQIQKSVWMSGYDHRYYLREEVISLKLNSCVRIFEASELQIKL